MSTLDNDAIVFVAAKRTPFGSLGGSLTSASAADLALSAAQACLKQAGLEAKQLDSIVVGNVLQSAADAIYLPRHVALKLGMPEDRPALGVNRLCGSGFEAIAQGAYQLILEDANAVLVGGTESMSQVPYISRDARFGSRLGHVQLEDYLMAALKDSYTGLPMAITAENLAEQYNISRKQVDEYALRSQTLAAKAWQEGAYDEEVAPIIVKQRKKEVEVQRDEHFRAETTIEGLAKLKPVFKEGGVVTAGTASGICDGAAMLIMCKESFAASKGLKVLGRLTAWAAMGCDPKVMGIGPVPATKKAMERWTSKSGSPKSVEDFDLIEINEAFSAQYLAVEKELGLDRDKTNLCGGAIALGHPLAASGARLVGHLLYDLLRQSKHVGLASACIGGGQGMSVIVEVD